MGCTASPLCGDSFCSILGEVGGAGDASSPTSRTICRVEPPPALPPFSEPSTFCELTLHDDRLHWAGKEERKVGDRGDVDVDPPRGLDNRLVPPVDPLVLCIELRQVGGPAGGVARGHR